MVCDHNTLSLSCSFCTPAHSLYSHRGVPSLYEKFLMRSPLLFACVALLLSSTLIAVRCQEDEVEIDDIEDIEEEKAFLLTRKSIVDEEIVVGRNTTVQIEINNAGTR